MQLLDKYHQSETNAHFFCQTKKKKKAGQTAEMYLPQNCRIAMKYFLNPTLKNLCP